MNGESDGQQAYRNKRELARANYLEVEREWLVDVEGDNFVFREMHQLDSYHVVGAGIMMHFEGTNARTRALEISKIVEENRW